MNVFQADIPHARQFLLGLAQNHTSPDAYKWLTQKAELVATGATDKDLYLAFSAAPRFMGKGTLNNLTEEDKREAESIRKGFSPDTWSLVQLARTLPLLSLPNGDKEAYLKSINRLFDTADMGELVALYGSLPLLPYPEEFKARAAEGIRTNIGDVFEAITQFNPYTADYLDEGAWNQLVLKTIFTGRPLYKIYGLEERRNPTLARMLSDYAHERWAAGRTVTPELWRPVGPFIDERILEDIKKLFAQPLEIQHEAAALACSQSNHAEAQRMLEAYPHLKKSIEANELNWVLIGTKALSLN